VQFNSFGNEIVASSFYLFGIQNWRRANRVARRTCPACAIARMLFV
jgi:hypothetical protein